jgi:hypothetical protein
LVTVAVTLVVPVEVVAVLAVVAPGVGPRLEAPPSVAAAVAAVA